MTLPKGRPAEPIRAPRGAALSCKGWPQEAALRMLMNNLDPDVAERWEDLVVYGGAGQAGRPRGGDHPNLGEPPPPPARATRPPPAGQPRRPVRNHTPPPRP